MLFKEFDAWTYNKKASFAEFRCKDKATLTQEWHTVFQTIIDVTPEALLFWVMENDASLWMCLPDAAHLAKDHFIISEDAPGWPFEFWETSRVTLVRSLTMGNDIINADIDSIYEMLIVQSLNCLHLEKRGEYLSISTATHQ